MAQTTTYQCPSCNGKLNFDSASGQLRCEFCDSLFPVEQIEQLYAAKQAAADAKAAGDRVRQAGYDPTKMTDEQVQAVYQVLNDGAAKGLPADQLQSQINAILSGGAAAMPSAAQASTSQATHVDVAPIESTGDPVKDYLARSAWHDEESAAMRAYNCPACGAQLMVDAVTAVTSCPYCGNNAVLPGQLSDLLKPDFVIPFKLDKKAAVAALKQYYQGKRLLPNGFTEENHLEEVQGVYVPFWLYSGRGTADVSFDARNTTAWADHKNNYVKTDHYKLRRAGHMEYDLVPVDGSTKMPDAHMDAIEPFDYSELTPFSVAYLPGYLTDRYDQDAQQCDERARNRVGNTCVEALQGTATGYMEIDVASASSDVEWDRVAYALLPVWMLHTKWAGNDYLFAMNGQTGKFIGDLPVDGGKKAKYTLAIFLPIAAIIAVLVTFLMGW